MLWTSARLDPELFDPQRLPAGEVGLFERTGVLVVLGLRLLVRRPFPRGPVGALAGGEIGREELGWSSSFSCSFEGRSLEGTCDTGRSVNSSRGSSRAKRGSRSRKWPVLPGCERCVHFCALCSSGGVDVALGSVRDSAHDRASRALRRGRDSRDGDEHRAFSPRSSRSAATTPVAASVPALVLGSIVMFLGQKYFVFEVRTAHTLVRETVLYVIVQIVGIGLTAWLLQGLPRDLSAARGSTTSSRTSS